ncbi:MAG TPA: methyltransferase domain-containing protein [Acidimicrobiales bacterium]|nr:methyltransferase domain-containing protein [Acidimicrobiales bacterium]
MPGEYALPNSDEAAAARFAAFESLFDPSTFRHLDALEVGPGWRCWEVGAGGTSVVRWLAERVGPDGRVLATDIDVTRVSGADGGAVEVRRHDVGTDPAPAETFDLVHARLVLVHVPRRDEALAAMVASLRPGGWLLLEDADPALQPLSCIDPAGTEEEAVLAERIRTGFRTVLNAGGADLAFGRTLPRRLRASGLTEVRADASFPVDDPACAALEAATVQLLRGRLVADGIAADEELDRHLAAVAEGRLALAQPPMIAAWGRKPD